MNRRTPPALLSTDEVARHCAHETERFFLSNRCDTRYGYELFRRALVERDEVAWEKVYVQYLPLVNGWIRQHSLFAQSGEEAQYFANRAFERMWRAMTPDKFKRFPNLKSMLRYLQLCVQSVIVDNARRAGRAFENELDESRSYDHRPSDSVIEGQVIDHLQNQALWRIVSKRLQNEKERHAVYGCFVLNLKPREVCIRFHDVFDNVNEVYRVKQNVLARLRRDPDLIDLFAERV